MASPDDEVFYAVHVEGDDGVLAFVGFQEGQTDLWIHESIFRQNCGGVSVLEEVDGGFAAPAGGVVPADEPVGNVDVILDILGRSALLQVVGDVTRSHGRSHRSGHRWPARNEL